MSCIPVSSERVQGCLTGLTHGGVVYTTRVYNPSSVASDVACKAHAEAIAAEFSKPKMKAQGPRQQQHAVQVKLTFLSLKLTFLSLKLTFVRRSSTLCARGSTPTIFRRRGGVYIITTIRSPG